MNKKLQKVVAIIGIIAFVAICAVVIYTIIMFVNNFSYTPELGIYDTRNYSFTLGDYLKYGKAAYSYTYTNLNIIEIIKRIW